MSAEIVARMGFCRSRSNVAHLLNTLRDQEGYRPAETKTIWQKRLLMPDMSLSESGVVNESTLYFVLSMGGGASGIAELYR
jgi:hypothetical protein